MEYPAEAFRIGNPHFATKLQIVSIHVEFGSENFTRIIRMCDFSNL